jgi:hypothetical protein
VSRTTWHKLVSDELAPRPSKLTRRPLWGTDELRAWVALDRPPAAAWRRIWHKLVEGGALAATSIAVQVDVHADGGSDAA